MSNFGKLLVSSSNQMTPEEQAEEDAKWLRSTLMNISRWEKLMEEIEEENPKDSDILKE